MIDHIEQGIKYGQTLNPDFLDLRFQRKFTSNFQSKDQELTSKTGTRRGFAARALVDGAWGFASTTSTDFEDLKGIIDRAVKLAKASAKSRKEKAELAKVKPHKEKLVSPRIKDLLDISIEEKIQSIKEAEKVYKNYDLIKSYVLNYQELIDHRIVANTEGTLIELKDMKPTVVAQAVAREQNKIAPYRDAWCKTKGYELIEEHPLNELAEFVSEQAIQNLEATLPSGGQTKVVIDHTSVGIIAHEAVGHCSEADLVEAGSFLKGKLGKKVCSELITIIDTPVLEDASGWLPYDDEGTKGKEVEIIKDGILKGYLTNREYAAKLGIEPTGNARAFTFQDEPLVRMRNTYIAPGDMTDEELFEAVGEGLFVTGMMNGSADTSGEFMVGTGQAFQIENGELTDKVFIGPTMTGNAFEMLSDTIGVGKNLRLNLGSGFCGKEQPAKVDAGGGKLATKVILGGR